LAKPNRVVADFFSGGVLVVYHFTGGKTPPEAFPVDGFVEAAVRALRRLGGDFAYYPRQHEYSSYSDKGYLGLRVVASSRYEHRESVPLPVENIVITAGSMQAIELLGRTFVRPGDTVITEQLTYYGTLQFFRYLQAKIVGIPVDERDGMEVDVLEDVLKRLNEKGVKPKFIYTIPNHHNPTGAILTESRRKQLLNVALEYGIPIIEDDCYGDLDFEPEAVPRSINTIDNSGMVMFVASFSKILAPGIRLGYFYASDRFLDEIMAHRWDLGTSVLASAVVAEFLKENMWSHISKQVAIIRRKRDTLMAALEEYLGDVASWVKPRGGLFLWVRLSEDVDMQKLQAESEKRGVKFDPGRAFHSEEKEIEALRLSYAHIPLDEIPNGIRLLAEAVEASR